MKKAKPRKLELTMEQIRIVRGAVGAETNDLSSAISARPTCQTSKFCCKPP